MVLFSLFDRYRSSFAMISANPHTECNGVRSSWLRVFRNASFIQLRFFSSDFSTITMRSLAAKTTQATDNKIITHSIISTVFLCVKLLKNHKSSKHQTSFCLILLQ